MYPSLLCVLALVLGLSLASCTSSRSSLEPPSSSHEPLAEDVGRMLRPLLDDVPGLSVAVGHAGEVVFAEAYGWAHVEARTPLTPDMPLRVYSLAKPWTAAAGLALVEQGRLGLQTDVRTLLPAFADKPHPITPYHLATHTAGIRHYRGDEAESERGCASLEDALALFSDAPLQFEPGSGRLYSSWGYVLLSAVLATAADRPFTALMDEAVFGPLGMSDVHLATPAAEATAQVAYYRSTPSGFEPVSSSASCKFGAGGFLAPPSDVVRFYTALLDGRMLSDRSRAMLLQPGEDGTIREAGASPGARAQVWADPARRLVVAIAGNAQGAEIPFDRIFELAEQIAERVAGARSGSRGE
jgi:CubicO group peptidase (beta-lactamase class C family)